MSLKNKTHKELSQFPKFVDFQEEKKVIYTITAIRETEPKFKQLGFYFDKETAIDIVVKNTYDIYETGYYPYCVIEEFEPGIYKVPLNKIWFMWYNKSKSYQKIDAPFEYSRTKVFAFTGGVAESGLRRQS